VAILEISRHRNATINYYRAFMAAYIHLRPEREADLLARARSGFSLFGFHLLALILAGAALTWAQPPGVKSAANDLSFDVASVRPSKAAHNEYSLGSIAAESIGKTSRFSS
jgi:hypothetical protein